MEFPVLTVNPAKVETACLVVPVFTDGDLLPVAAKLDDASERLIGQLIERGDFDAGLGNVQLIPFAPGLAAERLLLVGIGTRAKCNEASLRTALDATFQALAKLPLDEAVVAFSDVPVPDRAGDWKARMIAEATQRAVYRFSEFKSEPAPASRLSRVGLLISDAADAAASEHGARIGRAVGDGVSYARTLGNLPGNVCTPRYLAAQAEQLGHAAVIEHRKGLGQIADGAIHDDRAARRCELTGDEPQQRAFAGAVAGDQAGASRAGRERQLGEQRGAVVPAQRDVGQGERRHAGRLRDEGAKSARTGDRMRAPGNYPEMSSAPSMVVTLSASSTD